MPEKDKNSPRDIGTFLIHSKVSFFIIALNAVMYWFLHYHPLAQQYYESLIFYPVNMLQGNYWCFLTSGFVHLDWTHFALNMLGVFVFAGVVERRLGFWKTLLVYFGALSISMLFSSVVYYFFLHKNIVIIGASGAVMGLIAAAMLLDPFSITWEMILPLPVMIKGWLFLFADMKGFLSGETDGVSHLAHLFGFMSVALLMYWLSSEDRERMHTGLGINLISFLIFIILRNYVIKYL